MRSERTQRRIDAFLDEAEAAATRRDWDEVAEKARAVLAMDPDNEDAPALLRAAEVNLATVTSNGRPASLPATPSTATSEQPASFVGGRYAVRRFLGEGARKRVYLAHDERLDRDVAFALIRTEGLDEVGRERIVREAQAMGRLGAHPHVVTIFEIGEEGDQPYVVTELLGGGDVEGLLQREGGALPLARTLEIAKGVARGLAFAHQQGVVHRDLKPGNVWLTSTPRPLGEGKGEGLVAKIGDFGLAVALDRSRLTTHGLMVGTVAYMPPEQALGGEVTPQADLYSLGAMLYELVTGKPPFAGDSPTAVISQHINTPPVAPSWHSEHCPPDLEALILKLLAKVPADRPKSALEVLAALEVVDPEAPSVRHSESSANPLDRLARGVFVGRERELERLRAAFDEAFAGRGSVVMLVGEPGIGKTRTVQELSTYARMRGAKVLWGRAHEASGAPPYWPWTQVARAYRDQTSDDVRRRQYEPYAVDLQRIFPNLRALFPNLAEPPPVDSEEAQFQLFDALSSFLRAVSVDTPLVIVLDDLHWADRSTLRMLTHLAREVGMSRLLVTGTYRDTDLDRAHPLSQALAELNREDLFTRINLRGLTELETAAYICDTAQAEPSPDLMRRVHAETEGNPFFLSEVVRLMAEEGAFSSGAASEIRIPEGIKEALGRRLDRLSPEANELLSVAAVVGRECTHGLLSALTQFDDDTLLGLIEEALRARVLEETGVAGEYRFTHALMQDALYSELSTARRVRMHGRVAQALEATYGENLAGHGAELAHHFGEAAVMDRILAERAVQYSEIAAREAEAVSGWDEAARWYRQAVALRNESITDSSTASEAGLLTKLGRCLRYAGQRTEAKEILLRALAIHRERGDGKSAAETTLEMLTTKFGVGTSVDERPALIDGALEMLGTGHPHVQARLLIARAFGRFVEPDARRVVDEAAAIAAQHGYEDIAAHVLDYEMHLAWGQLRLSDGRDVAERSFEAFDQLGLFAEAFHQLDDIAQMLLDEGRLDDAVAAAQRGLVYAQRYHLAQEQQHSRMELAVVAFLRCNRDRFDALFSDVVRDFDHLPRMLQAIAAEFDGDVSRALTLVPTTETSLLSEAPLHGARARCLFELGDRDAASRAADLWDEALTRARSGSGPYWGFAGGARVNAYGHIDDALLLAGDDVIRRAYADLRDADILRLSYGAARGLDRLRGLAALHLGLIDDAHNWYSRGLDWSNRERCPVEAGRCLQGLADVAEARGDHSSAMEYLDGAAAKFVEHGAKLYLDQVLAKKSLLGA